MSFTKLNLTSLKLTLYIEAQQAVAFHHFSQSLFMVSTHAVTLLLALEEYTDKDLAIKYLL